MNLKKSIGTLSEAGALKIIGFGDSLTQGWMVRKGYLDFLHEMLSVKYPGAKITIINRGVPGDTSEGGLYRLRTDVLDLDPDLVLIQFALNDTAFAYPLARFRNNIMTMVEAIRNDTSAEILLVTSVPIFYSKGENEAAEEYYRQLIEIGKQESLSVALVHDYMKKRAGGGLDYRKLVQADQVHPTTEGYRLMAEAVMQAF